MITRKHLFGLMLYVIITCGLVKHVQARSVFIITDHNRGSSDNIVQVYETVGDQLKFQYQSDHFPFNGSGAVALAVTSDSGMLFASYDGDQPADRKIELVIAQTMEPYDTKATPKEMAGLVFDNGCHKRIEVYAGQRRRNFV